MTAFLDFEKQVAALDRQIAELREMGDDPSLNIDKDIARLEDKSSKLLREIYGKLTPRQKPHVARHPDRPHFKHYVADQFEDSKEEHTFELQSIMLITSALFCLQKTTITQLKVRTT